MNYTLITASKPFNEQNDSLCIQAGVQSKINITLFAHIKLCGVFSPKDVQLRGRVVLPALL